MNGKLLEIALRIKGLREILGITAEAAAQKTGVTAAEYEAAERGERDFSATFLLKLSELFGVDATDILTGKSPTLSTYTLTRSGEGLKIDRRQGFEYRNLAFHFKNRKSQPFAVTAPYSKSAQTQPIALSSHEGHEFNYILKGSLKFVINGREEVLNEGDSVYYNSKNPHGMIASGGKDCEFLAILTSK